jgi:indole-3-glycerol phosphate synthase
VSTPTSFLDRASADARLAAERRAAHLPLAELRRAVAAAPPARGFHAALTGAGAGAGGGRRPAPDDRAGQASGRPPRGAGDPAGGPRTALIAEVKRRSPSKGDLRPDLDPAALASAYRGGGASGVSVLTEPVHFAGSPEDLQKVRAAVDLPVLRKDFVTVPYQVWEARAWGADAVLLIVAALDPPLLADLLAEASAAGLDALVEVHTREEAAVAAAAGAGLIGVNARDLATLTVDLRRFAMVREALPPGATLVAESGIRTRADVEAVAGAGAHAVLVGEALVLAPDPEAAAAELLGRTRSPAPGSENPATKDG